MDNNTIQGLPAPKFPQIVALNEYQSEEKYY